MKPAQSKHHAAEVVHEMEPLGQIQLWKSTALLTRPPPHQWSTSHYERASVAAHREAAYHQKIYPSSKRAQRPVRQLLASKPTRRARSHSLWGPKSPSALK